MIAYLETSMLELPEEDLSMGSMLPSATCQNAPCCIFWDMNKCRNLLNIIFLNMSLEFN